MEPTTDRHHHITSGVFPEPNGILDNPAALHRANDVLYSYTTMGNQLVLDFLLLGQFLAARLFMRLCDPNALKAEADKTKKAVKNIQSKVEKPTLGDLGALAEIKKKLEEGNASEENKG